MSKEIWWLDHFSFLYFTLETLLKSWHFDGPKKFDENEVYFIDNEKNLSILFIWI